MLWPSSLVLRMAVIVAALALVLRAGWAVLHALEGLHAAGDQAGYERAQGEHQARVLEVSELARETERKTAARVARIERDAHEKQIAQERDAAGARSELERLRGQLAQAAPAGAGPGDPAAAAGRDGGAAVAIVAGECAAELLALAEAAEPVKRRLSALQAYVRALEAGGAAPENK
jgi:hypothetical protein